MCRKPRRPVTLFGIAALTLVSLALGSPAAAQVAYELIPPSTYTQGCFPPCLCPLWIDTDMGGTFRLTFVGSDGTNRFYEVGDVELTVPLLPNPPQVLGSGTYQVSEQAPFMQRMELDLVSFNNPAEHFDSGLVPGGDDFPDIDILVSINGLFCFDTALEIHAVAAADPFVRGDCNADGQFDVGDAVFALSALFVPGGEAPPCGDACDSNDDNGFDVADVIYTLGNLFNAGPPPPPPHPDCGDDPLPSMLGCEEFAACP